MVLREKFHCSVGIKSTHQPLAANMNTSMGNEKMQAAIEELQDTVVSTNRAAVGGLLLKPAPVVLILAGV